MASPATLAGLALLVLLVGLCRAHYQSDIGSLLRFGPHELPINQHYPQLQCTPVKASWADLSARFPVNAALFSSASSSSSSSSASTCESLARLAQEPFHPSQLLRNRPVLPWAAPGRPYGVPKALCRLGPNVSRSDFEAMPSRTRTPKAAAHLRRYRVLRGRLYVKGALSHHWQNHNDLEGYEEMLLLAVYLYAIPDMELWLSHGDEPVAQAPVLQYSMDLRENVSGCSMPYKDSWRDGALTLQQSMAWAACMAKRYPPTTKRRRAVWRGSTTDPHTQPINLSNALNLARVRLHMLGLVHSDVLDTKVSGIVQASDGAPALEALLGTPGNGMGFEEFQGFAAVLDIDGNSFSRRMHQLAQMGGPVLKQASPFPSYFEHLFAPGAMPILHYANNLSDVAQQAKALLEAVSQEPRPNAWDEAVENMHAVAAITLNRWSMIESVAYSLKELARHNTWVPTDASGFTEIPWTRCCAGGGGLPKELITAMAASERVERQVHAAVYSAADKASAESVLAAYAAASRAVSTDGGNEGAEWSMGAVISSTGSRDGSSGGDSSSGGSSSGSSQNSSIAEIAGSSNGSSVNDSSTTDNNNSGSSSSGSSSGSGGGASKLAGLSQHALAAHSWLKQRIGSMQMPSLALIALIGISFLTVVVWAMVAAGLLGRPSGKAAAAAHAANGRHTAHHIEAAAHGTNGRHTSYHIEGGRRPVLNDSDDPLGPLVSEADVEQGAQRGPGIWVSKRGSEGGHRRT